MTITISAEDPRSVKAVEIAAGAGQWLKCRTADGRKAFGIPSQCHPGRFYLVDSQTCDCPDFQRHGLSGARIGHTREHLPCKHILAVRLYCEFVKAQQKPRAQRRPVTWNRRDRVDGTVVYLPSRGALSAVTCGLNDGHTGECSATVPFRGEPVLGSLNEPSCGRPVEHDIFKRFGRD